MKCFIKIMIVLHVRPGREHIGCRRLTHRSSQSPAARALWTLPMTRQCDWPLFRQGEANPLRSAFYTCQPTRSQAINPRPGCNNTNYGFIIYTQVRMTKSLPVHFISLSGAR